jgi:glutathione S-transferase
MFNIIPAPKLRVFTFSPDWGLPTNGPFALKLLAWLELAGIPYEQVVENNSGKGPKGKSPWIEEHFHQVLEWELLIHPEGSAYMREFFGRVAPRPVASILFAIIRRQFRKQLHARGIARHTPEVIAAKGLADLDALAAFLQDRPFLVADQPTTSDTAVFGLLAPFVYWPMQTPVADHAKSLPVIQAYCDRMRERCFGQGPVSITEEAGLLAA